MKEKLFFYFPERKIYKILLCMKITLFLMLVFTLNLSATGFGQITLDESGKSVKEIMNIIENETDYRFFYNDDLKSIDNLVDISIVDGNINEILDKLFESTEFDYKIMDNNLIVITLKADQQQVPVTGKITDNSTGEPLAGVSIVVKGTTIGASSDVKGNFTFNVPDRNVTLVFSFIGYLAQEVSLAGRSNIDVMLAVDVQTLEEVIVVGYGTQKKSDITGTVASLPKERLQMAPNFNISQAIQGAVPGVMVHTAQGGASPDQTILVRGKNSITANNDPLIVVDGIPYGGNLSQINPNDIESIEVLKDASAAAIYGSRGANGVILVTTKDGVPGKTIFSYDGKFSVTDVTKVNRMLTGPEFYDFKMTRNPDAMTLSEEQVYEDGTWTNWTDLAIRMGYTQDHNLSVSGGFNDTKYYIGGGLLDIQGVAKNDSYRRFSTRINLETKLLDWLKVGTRTQLSFDNASGAEANFHVALETNPLGTAYDEYGNLTIWPWPDNIIVGNPLGPLLYDDLNKTYTIFTNNYVIVDIPFIKGLSYRLNTGLSRRTTDRAQYRGRDTQSGYEDQGHASISNGISDNITVENIFTYNRDFGKHSFFATGLYSWEGYNSHSNGLSADQFPNDFLSWYGAAQAKIVVPSENYEETNLISMMGRFNYAYNSKYLVTFTVRRDGYSGFGENTKWGTFPSAALGWNLAKEGFFPLKNLVNTLKLRASYGLNGNQAIGAYASLPKFIVANYSAGIDPQIGYKPSKMGVADLGWETSATLNFGMDFGLFKDRLTGSFDWYLTNTTDLLLDRSISVIHGITPYTHLPDWQHPAVTQNIGETQNRGIELALNSRNIVSGKFQWSTSANISFNDNKILSLYGVKDENGNELSDVANKWFIGQPIDVNYDYVWGGVWQLGEETEAAKYGSQPGYVKLKDINGDEALTPDDRRIIGQLEPKIIWGMTNLFTYGNFGLSIFIHGVSGSTVENYLMNDEVQGAEVRYNTLKKNWWTPTNPTNDWVMNAELANNMGGFSGTIYEKPDFVRIKDISFSYDLPQDLIRKAKLSKVKLFITGRNLITFTNWTGMDPDLTDEEGQQRIPMQKEYVFGVSLGF
jgi:TonB-linked SusC/RagA family outer membrane protein